MDNNIPIQNRRTGVLINYFAHIIPTSILAWTEKEVY